MIDASPIAATPIASGVSSTSTSLQAASRASVNYDAFLQLLVTELKNQDPLKPLDPTQTVSQLASFSAVEQAVKTNSLLAALAADSALSQASSLIGRTVSAPDGSATGIVRAVQTSDQGLVAILNDGREVALASGVVIS
jgi:flagellar basal-body rod modification protein FlgD